MGPLSGVKVVEFEGTGPGPMCGMLLADMGAEVVVIARASGNLAAELGMKGPSYFLDRGKKSLPLDLKDRRGVDAALAVVAGADALIEGFRPGVMERLGLGPDICLARNPRLVYGRLTGWGRDGPLAHAAGHDLNYAALAGVLSLSPHEGKPALPPTLIGDAGSAVFLAFGIVCGLYEARRSGRGQVVDQAMVDAAAMLTAIVRALVACGAMRDFGTGSFFHNSDFYDAYECADGRFVTVGALERKFYELFARLLGLPGEPAEQYDASRWPERKRRVAEVFRGKTRAEWQELLEGTDACFAPALDMDEAPRHPHMAARGTFIDVAGVTQPAPTPRFSRTPAGVGSPPPEEGEGADEVLLRARLSAGEIAALRRAGVLGGPLE